jgi:hypothetical protein
LQGRHLYPGLWTDTGYHGEAKGWIDEGLAEVMAGVKFPPGGGFSLPLRTAVLQRICASTFRDLSALLTQHTGYDQPGVFDYDNAWAFNYLMNTVEKSGARGVHLAFRDGTYQFSSFSALTQVASVSALQTAWHKSMADWCGTLSSTPIDAPRSPAFRAMDLELIHAARITPTATVRNGSLAAHGWSAL